MPIVQEIRRKDGTTRNSVYLNKELLQEAHINVGDSLEATINGDGTIILRKTL